MQVSSEIAKRFSYNPTWQNNFQSPEQLSALEVEDYFEQAVSSTSIGTKLGFGALATLTVLGVVGCAPTGVPSPPNREPSYSITADTTTYNSNAQKTENLDNLTPEEREQRLRERELELRQKELELMQKQVESQERLRRLQVQREQYEKGKRIGEGIGVGIEILGGIKDVIDESLR